MFLKIKFLFVILCLSGLVSAQEQAVIKLRVDQANSPVINRHIYGQFAEHLGRSVYDGFYRNGKTRNDIVEALKKIKVPNLRWPGGCFADQYHWRDGIGVKASRPGRINTTWGMVAEDNSFGTHEFLELCRLLGTEPYIAGNVGTGTPQEMSDWLEYLNFSGKSALSDLRRSNGQASPFGVSFWGVGNESWGCGGNMMPEHYANLYRQYASFCQQYPSAPKLKLVAGGANAEDYNWTEVLMKNIPANMMWGLSLHYYTFVKGGPWPPSGSATQFGEDEYFSAIKNALKIDEVIAKHSALMDRYDPQKKVALVVDEWGIWTEVEPGTNKSFMYQQNSLRDALIAASTLNIFNNRTDRIKMANLAQTVNVIHSLILTKGDEMVLTPTYHVFDLMKVHQDARLLPLSVSSPVYSFGGKSIPAVNVSASVDSAGVTNLTLVNLDANKSVSVNVPLKAKTVSGQVLTADKVNSFNDFGNAVLVGLRNFSDFEISDGSVAVNLPAKSVVQLAVNK